MIFVSNRTSRHWDVLFDRTAVDMSTDGRNLAGGSLGVPGKLWDRSSGRSLAGAQPPRGARFFVTKSTPMS